MVTRRPRNVEDLHLEDRLERLRQSKRLSFPVATAERFFEIDGTTAGGLIAIELFTTVIPLMILGFGYFSGFASNANVGSVFIRQLGLHDPLDDQFRALFGTSSGLKSSWTLFGVIGFLLWGIPMAITVASIFARAWRREQFGIVQRLGRGAAWFILYLALMVVRERIGYVGYRLPLGLRFLLLLVALIPTWLFWSLTPVILVRDGGRGRRYLALAGLAGVLIDGVIIGAAARIVFPALLKGWTGFGPIGVAMTIMTWCGVIGIAWVATACVGAVLWERNAPTQTVLEAATVDVGPSESRPVGESD